MVQPTILSDCMHTVPRQQTILLVSSLTITNSHKTCCNNYYCAVFGFNLEEETATVTLSGFEASSKVQAYELTAENDLYSQ